MATQALEELLIKIGFKVDQESLEKATQRGRELSEFIALSSDKLRREKANAEEKANKKAVDDAAKPYDAHVEAFRKAQKTKEVEAKRHATEMRQGILHVATALNAAATAAQTLATQLRKGALASMGIVAAAVKYTVTMDTAATKTLRFAETSGMAYDKLQQIDFAARRTGSGAGEMLGIMESLNTQLGEISQGGGPVSAIGRLGVDINNMKAPLTDSLEYLLLIADAYERSPLSKQQRAVALGEMGFGQAQIQLIQRGRTEIVRMMGDAKYTTLEAAQAAKKMAEEWEDSKNKFREAFLPIQVFVTQHLTKWMTAISNFAREHKGVLLPLLKAISVWMVIAFSSAGILTFISHTSRLIGNLMRIRAAFMAMSAASTVFSGLKGALGILGGAGAAATGAGAVATTTTAVTGGGLLATIGSILPVVIVAVVGALASFYVFKEAFKKIRGFAGQDTQSDFSKDFWENRSKQISREAYADKVFVRYAEKGGSVSQRQENTLTFNIHESKDPRATGKAVNDVITEYARTWLPAGRSEVF